MFQGEAFKTRLAEAGQWMRERVPDLWADRRWRVALLTIPVLAAALTFGLKVHRGSGLDLVIKYRFSAERPANFSRAEARVFYDLGQGTRNEDSVALKLNHGVNFSELVFPFPENVVDPGIRFDPSDIDPSQLEVYGIEFRDRISGKQLKPVKLSRISTWKEGVHITDAGDFTIIESLVDDPICKIQTKYAEPKARQKVRGATAAIEPALVTALIAAAIFFAGSLWWPEFADWASRLPRRWIAAKLDFTGFDLVATCAYAVAAIVLVWLFRGNYEAFRVIQEPFVPQFAGPKTPTSDGLGIWVTGALSFHALNEPYISTYRCLPAIWHASFLNIHFDIAWVPMAMFFCWLTIFTLFFLTANQVGKLYFLSCLWGVILTYSINFRILAPHVFGPGMMAFGGGVVGVYLVTQALFRKRLGNGELFLGALGFLSLGIAGSVRGPQLLAGASLLILAVLVAVIAKRYQLFALAGVGAVCFLLPGWADGRIRANYQVTNNGWSALYCAYTDVNHKWNPDVYIQGYLRNRPDPWDEQKAYHWDILKKFLRFRLSKEGWKDLGEKIWSRTYLDGKSFTALPFRLIGLGFVALALVYFLTSDQQRKLYIAIWMAMHGLVPLILDQVDEFHWHLMGNLLLSYMVLSVVFCLLLRLHLTVTVILAGYACMVFHACVGMTGSWRVAATYSNFMFLSYLLAPLEFWATRRRRSGGALSWEKPRYEVWAAVVYLLFLAGASFGSLLIHTDLEKLHRRFYLMEGEKKLVMKLSNDKNFDRSLYLPPRGQNHVFYTEYDYLEPGFFRVVDPDFYPKENGWRTLIDPLKLSPEVAKKMGGDAEASAAREEDLEN